MLYYNNYCIQFPLLHINFNQTDQTTVVSVVCSYLKINMWRHGCQVRSHCPDLSDNLHLVIIEQI